MLLCIVPSALCMFECAVILCSLMMGCIPFQCHCMCGQELLQVSLGRLATHIRDSAIPHVLQDNIWCKQYLNASGPWCQMKPLPPHSLRINHVCISIHAQREPYNALHLPLDFDSPAVEWRDVKAPPVIHWTPYTFQVPEDNAVFW